MSGSIKPSEVSQRVSFREAREIVLESQKHTSEKEYILIEINSGDRVYILN